MNIALRNVTKSFRQGRGRTGARATALADVTLDLAGGMTALLGPNGAGKTTLMRICVGVLRPDSGSVLIGGHDLATAGGRTAVKRMLGYLPQNLALYDDLTGAEFLDYIALLKGCDDKLARRRQVEELLELTALTSHASRKVGGYSGGMRRRLGIAQALLGDPRLIIVDEPTAGLDPAERMRFRALLASLGTENRTVILSTHILDDASQTCPEAVVLNEGRIAYHGSTRELAQAASGQAFLLPPGVPVPGAATIVNAVSDERGTSYRVVTDVAPPGAEPVTPTLEDGYVALLGHAALGSVPS